ncbi:MAG TPA: HAMP domain-containing sensor histidine kinase, partial [Sphingobacteriaceae bacterium]
EKPEKERSNTKPVPSRRSSKKYQIASNGPQKYEAPRHVLIVPEAPAPAKHPGFGKGKRTHVWSQENPDAYAALLRKEQRKIDSIFRIKDSLMRMRHPNAIAFTGPAPAAPDLEENFKLNIRVFEDEFGTHVTQELLRNARSLNRGAVVAQSLKNNPIKVDSVRQYIVMDPEMGPVVRTIPKPRVVSVVPPPPPPIPKPTKKEVKLVNNLIDSVQKNKGNLEELVTEFKNAHISLKKRIQPAVLDSLLRMELDSKGIKGTYSYKVTSAKKDSVFFTRISHQAAFLPGNTYQTALFPKDMIRDAGVLTITFPEKNSLIMSNMNAMMALSGALLVILLFSFGFTIHSILRQKKISEMKTDFINNMTHEFKTPVSTIMIASESLRDPDIANDKSRINRLASIIYDENVRLGNHIERVLNIARIDKGDLKLDCKPVDVNDLITVVLDSMSLQLQKKGTKLNMELNAAQTMVYGDELHLSNVIFNLIDNANKYSKENPEITISTENQGTNVLIRVIDNGIGMNRDQQSKIFDQFYRIPTGNLHDVKGFGLGLSYVNNIVKRLNGTIRVKSEKDKGSEFEMTFPVI